MKKSIIIACAVVAVLFLSGFSLYGYANATRTEGIQLEQGMAASTR